MYYYLIIKKNQLTLRNVSLSKEASITGQFTTRRQLIGTMTVFYPLVDSLCKALNKACNTPFILLFESDRLIVHQLEMIEEGISEVERRLLFDIGQYMIGKLRFKLAHKGKVFTCENAAQLTDQQIQCVVDKLE